MEGYGRLLEGGLGGRVWKAIGGYGRTIVSYRVNREGQEGKSQTNTVDEYTFVYSHVLRSSDAGGSHGTIYTVLTSHSRKIKAATVLAIL